MQQRNTCFIFGIKFIVYISFLLMYKEQSFPELDDFNSIENHQLQIDRQTHQVQSSTHQKKKLTKFIAQLFYKECPKDKKILFNLFWESYSAFHHLDTSNLKQRKTLERRFNEILNTLQACGFVKKTKKMIDIVPQNSNSDTAEGLQPNLSKSSQKINEKEKLKKSANEKQTNIKHKIARLIHLKQLVQSLDQHVKRNRSIQSQRKLIDLQSIVLIANQDKLPEITTINNRRSRDHQIILRGEFDAAGEMFEMLKLMYNNKQPIKTIKTDL